MSQRTIRHDLLAETIANIHRTSRGCYGARRVRAELFHGLSIRVGRDQMARTGLRGLSGIRRRYVNREHLVTTEDGYDNAMIESFWGTMPVELPNRKKWRTQLELSNAIFEYIEVCYNRNRRDSALSWDRPVAYESRRQTDSIPARFP